MWECSQKIIDGFLPRLKEEFECCGFSVKIHSNIQQLIWNKLFTNVSLSAVTGILQVDMGYIAANDHAWNMTVRLIREAVAVAHGLGLEADAEEIIEKSKKRHQKCHQMDVPQFVLIYRMDGKLRWI